MAMNRPTRRRALGPRRDICTKPPAGLYVGDNGRSDRDIRGPTTHGTADRKPLADSGDHSCLVPGPPTRTIGLNTPCPRHPIWIAQNPPTGTSSRESSSRRYSVSHSVIDGIVSTEQVSIPVQDLHFCQVLKL